MQALARLMFTLLNPCVQPWHLCSFHTISSRTIWQGKLELGSVQLEEVGWWLCSAPFSHGEDTQCPKVSKGWQPSRETPAPFNPDGFCKQWHGEGACNVVLLSWSILHLVKGEDMGMGLPKNNDGNDSLYFQSLNSASVFESRAGSGHPTCTDAFNS